MAHSHARLLQIREPFPFPEGKGRKPERTRAYHTPCFFEFVLPNLRSATNRSNLQPEENKMNRALTELVAELGEAARKCNTSASSSETTSALLSQVYEVALRELHMLQHERQKWEHERQQAAARDQCVLDDQIRNANLIKLNVVRNITFRYVRYVR